MYVVLLPSVETTNSGYVLQGRAYTKITNEKNNYDFGWLTNRK